MRRRRASLSLPVNGELVVVPGSPHLHCPKCGEQLLDFQEATRLQARAYSIYRARWGLLTASEIHKLRERLRLTQEGLAGLLRLGANTISRWETGRNVQTAAMDVLLRVVRDVPASLQYLQRTRSRANGVRRSENTTHLTHAQGDPMLKSSKRNQTEGKAREMKGKIKETAGRITKNPDLEDEGTADRVSGKIQKKVGQVQKVFED